MIIRLDAIIATSLMTLSIPVQAATLVSKMPKGLGYAEAWANQSDQQNFLVRVTFTSDVVVDGFEIIAQTDNVQIGAPTRIKIRTDSYGTPSSQNLYSFVGGIDEIATGYEGGGSKITTKFGGIALATGTYWLGMSGEGIELGWYAFFTGERGGQDYQRLLRGDQVAFIPSIDDLSYNVLGQKSNMSAVPEISTWAMMILGFGVVCYSMRRHRRAAVRFI